MKITNRLGLPQPIVDAVIRQQYDPGESDITVTTLIDSPQVNQLTKKHYDELEEDASMRIWSLFGQAIHTILERTEANALKNERLYANYAGYKIGGLTDRLVLLKKGDYEHWYLQDYKTSTTWEHIFGLKPEREQQLNIYKWLVEKNMDIQVQHLEIINLYKDWSPGQIKRRDDYPKAPVGVYPIRCWEEVELDRFMSDRLLRHFKNQPYCTEDEMWAKPGAFVVRKKGRKSALRRLPTQELAADWITANGHDDDANFYIEKEQTEYRRCETNDSGSSYCPVSQFCPQWFAIKEKDAVE